MVQSKMDKWWKVREKKMMVWMIPSNNFIRDRNWVQIWVDIWAIHEVSKF